ncbi:unnamed protein product, partial [Musa hybrid cultivar]
MQKERKKERQTAIATGGADNNYRFSLSRQRLLQVEGEEGEHGGPNGGSNSGGDREGRAGGARSRRLGGEGAGCRGGDDEDGTGNLSHLHHERRGCGEDEKERLIGRSL